MKTQITHLKLARYPELATGPVRPMHWDVDPSSVCDHRCRGCPYIFDGPIDPMLGVARPESAPDKRTFLDFQSFRNFLWDAQVFGARAITFVGGGEPTLHPRFVHMMQEVYNAGLKFGVITHLGRVYHGEFFEALALATWVRVSTNAATRETYKKHQGRDHFRQAMWNMEAVAKKGGPRIGMSFLITNDNHHEIVEAAQLTKDAGAAYIQYKPIIEVALGKTYEGIENDIALALDKAQLLASESFQVIDQWRGRLQELQRHARGEFHGPCHVQRFNPKLGANGGVYICCELAYSEEGLLGNIYEEPLAKILERSQQTNIEMSRCPHCWDKPTNVLVTEGRLCEASPPPESIDQEFL